jgi:hypothetical protein
MRRVKSRMPQALRKDALMRVFDHPSLSHALDVCLRLQRMKERTAQRTASPPFVRHQCSGRNYHHLTPRSRHGEAYYGTNRRNMLLIRVSRHKAWHDVFELQTLEETIALLMACVAGRDGTYFVLQVMMTLCIERQAELVRHRPDKKRRS